MRSSDIRAAIRRLALLLVMLTAFTPRTASGQRRILIYTRNYTPDGKGYVHENIAASVAAVTAIATRSGFGVDVSDDPTVFTDTRLAGYSALVFSNSNNEAFATEAQKDAFRRYIQHGGGFVGIHSASGSQRDWPYFWSVLGGKFVVHPKIQEFTVRVVDTTLFASSNIPTEFKWTDEYYFLDHLNPSIQPVLVSDRTKLQFLDQMNVDVSGYPNPTPLAWKQTFDGGREFYIAIGHRKEDYENPILVNLIEAGLRWASSK
jgi:type 1 glutamine amidotransferase